MQNRQVLERANQKSWVAQVRGSPKVLRCNPIWVNHSGVLQLSTCCAPVYWVFFRCHFHMFQVCLLLLDTTKKVLVLFSHAPTYLKFVTAVLDQRQKEIVWIIGIWRKDGSHHLSGVKRAIHSRPTSLGISETIGGTCRVRDDYQFIIIGPVGPRSANPRF